VSAALQRDVVCRLFIVSYLTDVNSVDRGSRQLSSSFLMMHSGLLGLGSACKQHYEDTANSVVGSRGRNDTTILL
jgi:hypothetical protein